ncbi:MAG: hypothetical protein GKS07_02320 [Nitrosopumilus sp.]|nr:MAG: hypothetical protein GKS07_02320 [Nitrosopumilus sp.]
MKVTLSAFFVLTLVALTVVVSVQDADAESADHNISPKKQSMSGIDIHEIQCREGYELILKASDWSPVCCKPSSVEKLIQRGWASDHDVKHDMMMEAMINLPEDTIDQEESMTKAKDMMKEAAENPTLVSEDMTKMIGDKSTSELLILKKGEFKGADFFHNAKGLAKIIENGDQTFLRFEMFEVTNGPDLRVYLTTDGDVKNGIQIDKLKGSTGDQNYLLEGIDVDDYNTVVIYCQPFGVYFGQAIMS